MQQTLQARLTSLVALFALALPAWAAGEDLATAQMVAEAKRWNQKGREDLAADIWRRLLVTSPTHPEALIKLGLFEARSGNREAAEDLATRAAHLSPVPRGLKDLTTMLVPSGAVNYAEPHLAPYVPPNPRDAGRVASRAQGPVPSRVQPQNPEARRPPSIVPSIVAPTQVMAPQRSAERARPADPVSGQTTPQKPHTSTAGNALVVPSATLPPNTGTPAPSPTVVLGVPAENRSPSERSSQVDAPDALQELRGPAAITERWAETRQRLEQLAQSKPEEPRYLAALATHLTYRESTRREAIRQLEALSQQGFTTSETRHAWRDALLLLNARSDDSGLYSSYLVRYPDDVMMVERKRAVGGMEVAPPKAPSKW